MLQELYPVRDEVLDRASLRPDDIVLDVGTGDGLIGFGALDRLGPGGRVIFSDVSQDLLDHCRSAADAYGQLSRCDFVLTSADGLDGVPDGSVDVITARSVLIYVSDKAAAFAAFRRVLRPAGRVSIFEPINTLMQGCSGTSFFGYDLSSIAGIAAKLNAAFAAIQPPGIDPMVDFDDRDLMRLAEQAGFGAVGLDLRVSVKPTQDPVDWEQFLRMSGNPNLPPLAEMIDQVLSATEAAEFTACLRPLVEEGRGERRLAVAYLTAT